ncbi:MAG: AAA family ATPase [Oscillospiraceae bacterium]|nr:AAA family ATPase [Oscillospiraceae bacterium]
MGCIYRQITYQGGDAYAGNGYDKDGSFVRHGQGSYVWSDGDRYEGDWLNGVRTGKGKFYWTNGNRYEGDFVNGVRTGKGKFYWANGSRYEGDYTDNKMNGKGVFYYANGNRYEGPIVNNYFNGTGKFYWLNGDRYEGDFVNDCRTGKGALYKVNRDRYEGDFVNGYFHGKGTYYWADGGRYEGDFVNDYRTGKGTFYWASGERYEGDFVNSYLSGKGSCYWPDGQRYEGDWLNGARTGNGKFYWANGNLKYEGGFQDKLYHGDGKSYREDGSLEYEGRFQNGKPVNRKTDGADLEKCLAELDAMIGLAAVKEQVRRLVDNVRVNNEMRKRNLPVPPMSYHMAFTGNPGTGKTTVARLMGKIYANLGILSKGTVIEATRKDLVGEYIGHTAPKTNELVQKALGGALFIDEAYELYKKDTTNDFGLEAIAALLKNMEDFRDDLVVIVAGYQGPIEEFLESNPGLKSRFNTHIHFDNYSLDELISIFRFLCAKDHKTIGDGLEELLSEQLSAKLQDARFMETFSNGRYVRNLYEKLLQVQSVRLSAYSDFSEVDDNALLELTVGDLRAVIDSGEFDKTA